MIEQAIEFLKQKDEQKEAIELEKQLERIYRTVYQEMLKIDMELDRREQVRGISKK